MNTDARRAANTGYDYVVGSRPRLIGDIPLQRGFCYSSWGTSIQVVDIAHVELIVPEGAHLIIRSKDKNVLFSAGTRYRIRQLGPSWSDDKTITEILEEPIRDHI